jgi:hypothetical protein
LEVYPLLYANFSQANFNPYDPNMLLSMGRPRGSAALQAERSIQSSTFPPWSFTFCKKFPQLFINHSSLFD